MTPCEIRGTGETDDGSRSEVRGFPNFELRTAPFSIITCFTRHSLDCRVSFLQLSPLCHEARHRPDSFRRGKINRNLKDQQGLAFCKAVCGRSGRSDVANDLALHEIDYQFGDVSGMIGHPFEIFGNKAQPNGA